MVRSIFRWIHIILAIPILGYIYSPFDRLPDYAFKTRFVFVPAMVLSGLWMWKGHVVRRLFSRGSILTRGPRDKALTCDKLGYFGEIIDE